MILRIALSLLLSCICFHTYSQSYDDHILIANALYRAKDYFNSAKEFDSAFKLKEGNKSTFYNAACSWALAGDTIKALAYINLSIDKGWMDYKHLSRDKDLISLHSTSKWKFIVNRAKAKYEEDEKKYNVPLKRKIEAIYVKDQTLRGLVNEAEKKYGNNSEEMNYFWKLMSDQDSLNEIEITTIIDEEGWLGRSEVGEKANMTIWLVIQHAPIEIQEKYLALMKESVKKGESRGRHLALLEDRILMRNNKPQKYGSQIVVDHKTGRHKVYEVFEPEYVNQRRNEVGLGPIENYIKNWNLEWSIEQKTK